MSVMSYSLKILKMQREMLDCKLTFCQIRRQMSQTGLFANLDYSEDAEVKCMNLFNPSLVMSSCYEEPCTSSFFFFLFFIVYDAEVRV